MQKDFLFIDLSEQTAGAKPFDGMAAGEFTDMYGRAVSLKADDLEKFVANTRAALESTRDSSGEVVGFPIDTANHAHKEAAGWIVGVELDESGNKLRFMPRWNETGKQLIASNTMRYFSPSVDLKAKTVVGGSLTNWPATRTAENHMLLRPVELSMDMVTNDLDAAPAWIADLKELISGLVQAGRKPEQVETPAPVSEGVPIMSEPIVELSAEQTAQLETLVEERAALRFQNMVEAEKRKNRILEFTRAVTGKGLPVQGEDLTAFLSDLAPDALDKATALFQAIADAGAVIDFEEKGHSKTLTGAQSLPPEMVAPLQAWLAAGQTLEDFFKVNAVELGVMTDYNLSEFVVKE